MTGWPEVAERIAARDPLGMARLLAAVTEENRRSLAPKVVAARKDDESWNPAIQVALIGTGTRSEADRLNPWSMVDNADAYVEILAARNPPWLESWMTSFCEREPQAVWDVARALRLKGIYSGDDPAYALSFLGGIGRWARRKNTIYENLRADPAVLDDELWRAFQIEGGGEVSFAAQDKYRPPELTWSAAFRRLVAEGLLERQRLIDATLDALGRGYSAFRAGWFVRFHDELEPTAEERLERLESYLGLLGSPTAQVQSFAVNALAEIDKTTPLPEPDLVEAIAPAVLNPAKGTAAKALRLLDAAARRSEISRSAASRVAAEALLHESPDVQGRALAIVERFGEADDAVLVERLAGAAPVVASSLQPRLAAVTGTAPETASDPPADVIALAVWPESVLDARVLEDVPSLTAVKTPAELALVVARALEHPEEIETLELAIDGISRLCRAASSEPPAVWVPMRKRAERSLHDVKPFAGNGPAADFAGLVMAWLSGEQPPALDAPRTVMGFLSARLHAVAHKAAAGTERALLSTPTHARGWIDPEVLAARLAQDPRPSDHADLTLALLRIAPERRDIALSVATGLKGEAGAALRFALGSDREKIGSTRELWVAAARARHPGTDAPELGRSFRKLGGGAAAIARPRFEVVREQSSDGKYVWYRFEVTLDPVGDPPSILFPTVAMSSAVRQRLWWNQVTGSGAATTAGVRWCATLHPADLDPFFLDGLVRIANNRDWSEAHWEEHAFLEPLLELPTHFSQLAVRLVAAGLSAKEPGIRGLATEAAARALVDGRLTPDELGVALGREWAGPQSTPRRFATSLAGVATASDLARAAVRRAMIVAFRSPPHTDAAPILELLNELCHKDDARIEDPAARSSLDAYSGGKAGRLARGLLAT